MGKQARAGLVDPALAFTLGANPFHAVPSTRRVGVGPFLVDLARTVTTGTDIPSGPAAPAAENEVDDDNDAHENYKYDTRLVHFGPVIPKLF
jgi:hypothetical protein